MGYEQYRLNLQLFGDGGAGAGAGAGGGEGGTAGVAAGAAAEAAAPQETRAKKRNPLADVQYGIQPQYGNRPQSGNRPQQGAQAADAAQQGQATATVQQADSAQQAEEAPPQRTPFEELVRGEYKQDYDRAVQSIVRERLKGSKQAEETLARLQPLLEAVGQRYGVDASDIATMDIDQLNSRVLDDNSLYEDEAAEKGISVDTLKRIRQMERENDRLRRQEQDRQRQAQFEQHLAGLVRQGEELKQIYPGFDLRAELNNPEFARLTSPGVGVNVRTAYEVVHRDAIQAAAMQFTAQKVQEKLSNSVQANAARPDEAGIGNTPGMVTKTDPRTFTREDRAEIRRRVHAGEKIYF